MHTFAEFLLEQEKKKHPVFYIGFHRKKKKKKKLKEDMKLPKPDRVRGGTTSLHAHLEAQHHADAHFQDHEAIMDYSLGSRELNHALIDHHKGLESTEDLENFHGRTLRGMDRATTRFRTTKDMVVHSGVGFSPGRLGIPNGGKLRVHLPAFTSTTIVKEKAHTFAKPDNDYHFARVHVGDGKFEHKPVSRETFGRFHSLNKKVNDAYYQGKQAHDAAKGEMAEFAKSLGHVGASPKHAESFKQFGMEAPYESGMDVKPYSHMISVHVPKESHGLYMWHYSDYKHEKEFVLPRNSQVEIHSNPRINHEKGMVEWRGHLVHDGVNKTSLHPKDDPQGDLFK